MRFKIEIKSANGVWTTPTLLYPDLPLRNHVFPTREQASVAKGHLKNLLRDHARFRKAPVRIVAIQEMSDG